MARRKAVTGAAGATSNVRSARPKPSRVSGVPRVRPSAGRAAGVRVPAGGGTAPRSNVACTLPVDRTINRPKTGQAKRTSMAKGAGSGRT